MASEWANPTVLSGIVAGVVTILTMMGKNWADRRSAREQHRHTDRELLSMDEHRFRETLIKELTACRDSHDRLDKDYERVLSENRDKDLKITRLQWQVERLCFEIKKLNPDFDQSICERNDK